MKQEVVELGQRIDMLEQAQDAREEELDCHRRELLALLDKNQELQYQIEDLENRSRSLNIRIKGVPSQAMTAKLEDFEETKLWCLTEHTGLAGLLARRAKPRTY
ncbi:hypothetical protein NDU88_001584 [Pleurodeles waltl]|uniref:Uncharacterized protein n=1 Tax=Pleurodeles waltl TaxID=8319 RepID=A0AAV7LZ05_PLEWA|nr:hypothetical protein NDU88_001584 [Pleurodeles waltl]